ncbi:hypothetical protein GW17_00041300 [Ensete ventricosum]|nr:hypothetical protein GW17_00041300 [Ensete ventricosum]
MAPARMALLPQLIPHEIYSVACVTATIIDSATVQVGEVVEHGVQSIELTEVQVDILTVMEVLRCREGDKRRDESHR